MCFSIDYDWIAEVCEHRSALVEQPERCDECGAVIPYGAVAQFIHMEQREFCQRCEDNECECAEDSCCQCEEPDLGEVFDYVRCESCNAFLNAVQIAEEEAGCSNRESRPPLGCALEYIRDGGIDEADKYRKTAVREYPWLVRSGYLGWLWQRMFR